MRSHPQSQGALLSLLLAAHVAAAGCGESPLPPGSTPSPETISFTDTGPEAPAPQQERPKIEEPWLQEKSGGVHAFGHQAITLGSSPPVVAAIQILSTGVLWPGASVALSVIVYDQNASIIPAEGLEWSSNDEAVATVDGDGVVLAIGPGIASIEARVGGVMGAVQVRVAEPARIDFGSTPGSLLVGQDVVVLARAVDPLGVRLPVPVALVSSDESIVSLQGPQSSWAIGVGPGVATIQASAADLVAEFEIEVRALEFESVSVGPSAACALTTDGEPRCWGEGLSGYPVVPSVLYEPPPTRLQELSVGTLHVCALDVEGEAYCVGDGTYGQLGSGGTASVTTFRPVSGGIKFRRIAAGAAYTCGVTIEGAGYCWGTSTALGIDPFDEYPLVPRLVFGSLDFDELRVTSATNPRFFDVSCGVTVTGEGSCWGANFSGELGSGSLEPWSLRPAPIAGDLRFSTVNATARRFTETIPPPGDPMRSDVSFGHGCGVTVEGEGYCWGANERGELGDGTGVPSRAPVRVETSEHFQDIQVQAYIQGRQYYGYSCGLTISGTILCWGDNSWRQLGDGSALPSGIPTPVAGGYRFRSFSLGERFGCGQTLGGLVYCWGASPGVSRYDPALPPSGAPGLVIGQLSPAP